MEEEATAAITDSKVLRGSLPEAPNQKREHKMRNVLVQFGRIATLGLLAASVAFSATAGELSNRIANKEPIRIGYSYEVPFAYPGTSNEPVGFVNAPETRLRASRVPLII
ncbi:hypothetical protein GB927_021775 [Shinella sp. CPCC 100929]|uniref:Uncharacterized protein n=1 Tax=Shinella lacus TaxID=2654216 RepID=A0ABT1RBX2_9HYPH|nr:hypothetical protein [Shinella lacus]MCQ4632686.1 hypothetical protein [Shinella lacus]